MAQEVTQFQCLLVMFLFYFPGAHILAKNSFSILNGSKFQFLKMCVHYHIIQTCKCSFYTLRTIFLKHKSDFDFTLCNIFLHTWTLQEIFLIKKNIFLKRIDPEYCGRVCWLWSQAKDKFIPQPFLTVSSWSIHLKLLSQFFHLLMKLE